MNAQLLSAADEAIGGPLGNVLWIKYVKKPLRLSRPIKRKNIYFISTVKDLLPTASPVFKLKQSAARAVSHVSPKKALLRPDLQEAKKTNKCIFGT